MIDKCFVSGYFFWQPLSTHKKKDCYTLKETLCSIFRKSRTATNISYLISGYE